MQKKKKQPLSEVIIFFVLVNSNVPLIKKPNSKVSSHTLSDGFGMTNSSNVILVVIALSTNYKSMAQKTMQKNQEHSWIEKPIKPI